MFECKFPNDDKYRHLALHLAQDVRDRLAQRRLALREVIRIENMFHVLATDKLTRTQETRVFLR